MLTTTYVTQPSELPLSPRPPIAGPKPRNSPIRPTSRHPGADPTAPTPPPPPPDDAAIRGWRDILDAVAQGESGRGGGAARCGDADREVVPARKAHRDVPSGHASPARVASFRLRRLDPHDPVGVPGRDQELDS